MSMNYDDLFLEFNDNIKFDYSLKKKNWFEARAYAKYKSLDLPNIYQWLDAALLSGFTSKLPELKNSNYNSTKLVSSNPSDINPNGDISCSI